MKKNEINIRPVEPSDLEFLYSCENDLNNWTISGTSTPFSKNTLKDYLFSIQDIYTDKQLRLIICNEFQKPIGILDLFDYDQKNSRVGIGILLVKNYQNQGYGKLTLEYAVNYCFETLFLHQIYCNIMESNLFSIRLFESFGFKLCGIKKEWIQTTKGWQTENTYQLINK